MSVSTPPAAGGVDQVGRIETRGVDYIPEAERHSKPPRELTAVFFGTQLCFGIIVFLGYLPVSFGLVGGAPSPLRWSVWRSGRRCSPPRSHC